MALENLGLGGVLSFDHKAAVSGMNAAGGAAKRFGVDFGGLVDVAKRVGQGFSQAASAMGGLGLAAAPATAAFGYGFKQAADFEKQMSAVGAVSQATAEDMARLEREAKKQGATTSFSATEAGEGMEFLARAGFTVDQQIAALGPTLNAAAADGIGLAQSADIISNTLKGMGLEASQAARAADVLALASAKTNTNMSELGEAMRYASPQAKTLGIDLETTTAVLGAAADAGLKGSIGGTSFTQALIKLAKPSREGAELLDQFNIKMTKTASGGLDMVDVFKQIHARVSAIPDVMERARVTEELFGVRGMKAFTAVETAIDTGKIDTLVGQLQNAKGAAEEMAKTRLDNFAGSVTLLTSAMEGFSLETAGRFLDVAKESIQSYTGAISNIVLVLQELNSEEGLTAETANKAGGTMVAIAKGIKEGIDLVIDTWREMRAQITDTIAQFVGGQSSELTQKIAKIATVAFIVTAAIAPILVAFAGVAFFISSVVIPAIGAIGTVIGAIFSAPVLAAIAIVVGGFMMFREEGETIGQTFERMIDGIVAGFDWVMTNGVEPFISGFEWVPNVFDFVWDKFQDFVFEMRAMFGDVIGGIIQAAQALAPAFRVAFTFIGNIVGVIVAGIGLAFTTMFDAVKGIMGNVRAIVLSVLESVVNFIKKLSFGIGYVGEALGFDWGAQLQNFGQDEFRVQVGVERGLPEKKIAEDAIDTTVSQELIDQANNELLAMQVGQAVADNMPKEINVESKVCVDGKTIAKATEKHKQEIHERAGFKATPWQRRAAVEHGAAPVGGI